VKKIEGIAKLLLKISDIFFLSENNQLNLSTSFCRSYPYKRRPKA